MCLWPEWEASVFQRWPEAVLHSGHSSRREREVLPHLHVHLTGTVFMCWEWANITVMMLFSSQSITLLLLFSVICCLDILKSPLFVPFLVVSKAQHQHRHTAVHYLWRLGCNSGSGLQWGQPVNVSAHTSTHILMGNVERKCQISWKNLSCPGSYSSRLVIISMSELIP